LFADLERSIAELDREKDEIVSMIQTFCWKGIHKKKHLPGTTGDFGGFVLEGSQPPKRAVPEEVRRKYQSWFTAVRAIVAHNQPDRIQELDNLYSTPAKRTGKVRAEPCIKELLTSGYISESDQILLADLIGAQADILAAVPRHLTYSLLDMQLATYAELMDDELLAARELLRGGFLRPAGVLAGVMLERHLKNLLRRRTPPVKVPERATLGKVNDLCRDAVYDVVAWRKVQHLTDLRNLCSHETGREPTATEIRELMDGVSALLKTQFQIGKDAGAS